MRFFHLLWMICLILSPGQGQPNIDSLNKIREQLLSNNSDTYSLVLAHNSFALSQAYEGKGEYPQAINYLNQALSVFKVKNETLGLAKTYFSLAQIHREQGKNDQGLRFYQQALRVYKKLRNYNGILECLIGQGVLHKNISDYSKALQLFSEGLTIAQQTNNEARLAQIYRNMGTVYRYQGYHAQELKYHLKALEMNQKLGKTVPIAYSYGGVGNAYASQGNYPAAIASHFKALVIFEKLDRQPNIAYTYKSIANIYTEQKKYTLALNYYDKALKIRQKAQDKPGIAYALEKMGNIYSLQGEIEKARHYLQSALSIDKEINQTSWMAYCYEKLGKLELSIQQYDEALAYFKKSFELQQALGEKMNMAASAIGIGKVFYYQQKYQAAIDYLKQAVTLAQAYRGLLVMRDASEMLAKSYQALGDYKNAFQYHLVFKQMTDSVFNQDNTAQITRLATSYQFQKEKDSLEHVQQKKQLAFDAEMQTHRVEQRLTVLGLSLVSILLMVLLWFFIDKQKSNRKLSLTNVKLEQSNEEILSVNDSLTDALDVVREQKNSILSSITYAQRIQKAILPSDARLREAFPEHFILFRPRDIVSGDFYWFAELEPRPIYAENEGQYSKAEISQGFSNKKYILAAIDCTGHGVPGAFMSMIANDLLNYIVNKKHICSADQILNQLHVEVQQALHQSENHNEDGMEMSLVVVEPESKRMQFAGAGNHLWYCQNGHFNQIKGDRWPIGGEHWTMKQGFTRYEVDVSSPTTFYLFSDGYQDQFGGDKGKKFMRRSLQELLVKNAPYPMDQQKLALELTLSEWMQGYDQIDDILVMGVKV